jgi:hypothetical protein
MPISLSKAHRKLLENTTAEARVQAESACKAALENLAVHEKDYRGHMTAELRLLRNRLRARGRALGDKRDERSGVQGIHHLKELAAYEHWHRLLFTRFLTENHLLITDEANGSVPITLQECEELAPELGARDGFDLACRFASLTLPGVFRSDDPVLDLPVALNDQVGLRKLLGKLPSECFRADDALGWTYQFWQAQRKKEVNDSGTKIDADELSPVTQLFTEDYMVEFILHNTLGAWWAGKLGVIKADNEEEARAKAALPAREGIPAILWTYLRLVQDTASKTWLPAAGRFDDWPRSASLIRLLDPCMGSGHFLVSALPLLIRFRMEEERLEPKAAVVAVLNDNIHGLELDDRCTQIAAFNVALAAWRLAGYQRLPALHIACSGQAPSATEAEWTDLAGEDDRLRRGMVRLYSLFRDAPVLGSLINPEGPGVSLIEANFHELAPLLSTALGSDHKKGPRLESDAVELVVIAQGLSRAAEMLADKFTLVVTNVPYVTLRKQSSRLSEFNKSHNAAFKQNLATSFLARMLEFCDKCGTCSTVMPQDWLFLDIYEDMRRLLLTETTWHYLVRLGTKAFRSPMWDMNIMLFICDSQHPPTKSCFAAQDVSGYGSADEKAEQLPQSSPLAISQYEQLSNPDARVVLHVGGEALPLSQFATALMGVSTGDGIRFNRNFWEVQNLGETWSCLQSTVSKTQFFGGQSEVVRWEQGQGEVFELAQSVRHLNHSAQNWARGRPSWGKLGVVISQMGGLSATLYLGDIYDCNCCAVVPIDPGDLLALWSYCQSPEFAREVRIINQALKVPPQTLLKIPFDLSRWRAVAAEDHPDGLPNPHSTDPTQWLFNGQPKGSDQPLHVGVARLLGYRWPRQTGSSFPDCPALGTDGLEGFADSDGIVCLPPVNHEQPAANRLRSRLAAALGTFDESSLIAAAGLKGSKSKTLEDWLRDEFFEQHAKLFHDRPFIWHLWDGRSDGFHAFVNYHKLDHATLQKLTYSYLGDWIQQQDIDAKADKPGAADRLGAAQKLQKELAAILEGEAPLDVFARWKPIKFQSQGWHPDLNDGVHQNIRPFLLAGDVGKRGAGLFRSVPLKLNDSDRGNEPNRPKKEYPWFWCEDEPGTDPVGGKEYVGARWNNVHLTLEMKKGSKG